MIKEEKGEKREFSTGAKKQNAEGKGTPALFPPDAYLEISKHFEEGANTHGARNWEAGIPLSELINSLERHIAQEKMGLTEESHDRALAWNAVVYLATKLRIKAGILPKELDDLEGAYVKSESKPDVGKCMLVGESSGVMPEFQVIHNKCSDSYYITNGTDCLCWNHEMHFPIVTDYTGYFNTRELAQHCIDVYNKG